jgi:hypothetical protein
MPFKKGNKLGKKWKPRQSGNASGRPKLAEEVRARADKLVPSAFGVIEKLMTDADKDSVRLSAAVRVLQVAGVPMGEVKVEVRTSPEASSEARRLPDEDLDSELSTPESVN